MIRTFRKLWATNRLLLMGFTAAFAITLFFGIRVISSAIYWNDPAHRNQTIEGWMTIRYVANSWQVPPKVIVDALASPPSREGRPVRLQDIAFERGYHGRGTARAVECSHCRRTGRAGTTE